MQAHMLQVLQKCRTNSSRSKASLNIALLVRVLLLEAINLLHLDNVAFHASDLADADHAPASVGQSLQLDQQPDCRGDLTTDAGGSDRHAGHADHLLQPP